MCCMQLEELQAEAAEEERVRQAEARAAAARTEHEAAARAAAAKAAKTKAVPVKKALLGPDLATVPAPAPAGPAVPAAANAPTVTPPANAPCALLGAAPCVMKAAEMGLHVSSWSHGSVMLCGPCSVYIHQLHRAAACRSITRANAIIQRERQLCQHIERRW